MENVELYIIYHDFFLHENWPSLPPFKVKVLGKFEGAVEAIINKYITVKNNSPIQDYVHPDDQTQPTFEKLYCHNFAVVAIKSDCFRNVD